MRKLKANRKIQVLMKKLKFLDDQNKDLMEVIRSW